MAWTEDVYSSHEYADYCQIFSEEIAFQYAELEVDERLEREELERMEEGWQELMHGFRTMPYDDYLRTSWWWNGTRSAEFRYAEGRCRLCNEPAIDVHHNAYANLGEEKPRDVVALCRRCHYDHHERMKLREIGLN
jgi:hypothetical protein